MDLKDKVTIVTGAGSGIGRALAQRFAADGARAVVCADLRGDDAQATAQGIGAVAQGLAVDVSDEAAVTAMVRDTQAQFGGLDVVVSNAGYGQRGGLDLSTDDWQRMMSVHTWSHLWAAQAAVPGMVKRGGGYLLSTASAAGLLTQMDSGPYAVSKHAAVALAEWLSINYGEQGIGVSVLCPQAVRTNIMGNRVAGSDGPKAAGKNTGQASGDGVLEPELVADECVQAMHEGRFLVLPHPEVLTYFQRKASDYDRWLGGMRRFRERLLGNKK